MLRESEAIGFYFLGHGVGKRETIRNRVGRREEKKEEIKKGRDRG